MLTDAMKALITDHSAGMVATVNDNGAPSVSPKATFVVLDDATLAFGNIRSPGTLANLRVRPAVEVCFIDVLARKAVRVTGTGQIIRKGAEDATVREAFMQHWGDYVPHMSAFVIISLTAAEMILSPAYDLGFEEPALRAANLQKLNSL